LVVYVFLNTYLKNYLSLVYVLNVYKEMEQFTTTYMGQQITRTRTSSQTPDGISMSVRYSSPLPPYLTLWTAKYNVDIYNVMIRLVIQCIEGITQKWFKTETDKKHCERLNLQLKDYKIYLEIATDHLNILTERSHVPIAWEEYVEARNVPYAEVSYE
jgi:hypothetical protein